jgi:hypothetical protein
MNNISDEAKHAMAQHVWKQQALKKRRLLGCYAMWLTSQKMASS